jgi:hypothetical protein
VLTTPPPPPPYITTLAETPKPNHYCPRRNGFFAHPEPAVCNKFYNCIEGEHTEITCTAGLHFDEFTGTCVWPDAGGRQGCNKDVTSKTPSEEKMRFLRFCSQTS